MAELVNGLEIRKRLGRQNWSPPISHGPDGFAYVSHDRSTSVIVSGCTWDDGTQWIHASIAGKHEMPAYEDLAVLHRAVWGDGWAYQVFAPPADHVNLHEHALHLWGRADGSPVLPNFGQNGSI